MRLPSCLILGYFRFYSSLLAFVFPIGSLFNHCTVLLGKFPSIKASRIFYYFPDPDEAGALLAERGLFATGGNGSR